MVVHTCSSSIQETEATGSWFQGQFKIHEDIPKERKKTKQNKNINLEVNWASYIKNTFKDHFHKFKSQKS